MKVKVYESTKYPGEIAIVYYDGYYNILYDNLNEPTFYEAINSVKRGLDNVSLLSCERAEFLKDRKYFGEIEITGSD